MSLFSRVPGKRTEAIFVVVLFTSILAITANSCVHQPYVLPANQQTYDPNICFERDILPVFIANCTKSGCHNAADHEGGYVLDNYHNIMSKGIVPGNYAASKIWGSITIGKGEGGLMPKDAARLSATQLDLIKRWIKAGAVDSGACSVPNCDTGNFTYSGAITPMMQLYCVGCHNTTYAPGGTLTDYNSVKTAAVYGRLIGNISHQAGYIAMPPGYKLSDCEVAQVKKWVAQGAPDN